MIVSFNLAGLNHNFLLTSLTDVHIAWAIFKNCFLCLEFSQKKKKEQFNVQNIDKKTFANI